MPSLSTTSSDQPTWRAGACKCITTTGAGAAVVVTVLLLVRVAMLPCANELPKNDKFSESLLKLPTAHINASREKSDSQVPTSWRVSRNLVRCAQHKGQAGKRNGARHVHKLQPLGHDKKQQHRHRGAEAMSELPPKRRFANEVGG
jgi:hypothetical protein